MHYFLMIVIVLSWWVGPVWSDEDHGLPTSANEFRAYAHDAHNPYVHTGCFALVPASSLIFAAFPCTGYVENTAAVGKQELAYASQDAVTITLPAINGTHWLALVEKESGSYAGWGLTGTLFPTHYRQQQSATRPLPVPGVLIFREVTVAGLVITISENTAGSNPGAARVLYVTDARYGAVPNDGLSDSAAFQAAHDSVPVGSANSAGGFGKQGGFAVRWPPGEWFLDVSLLVDRGIDMGGTAAPSGRWNARNAPVRIVCAAALTTPCIDIAATANSLFATPEQFFVEGVYLHDFLLLPDTVPPATGAEDGILIDGGDSRLATRFLARDITLERVQIWDFAGNAIQVMGNVFDLRIKSSNLSGRPTSESPFHALTSTVISGIDNPTQVYFTDTYITNASTDVVNDWAVKLADNGIDVHLFGGGVTGQGNGVELTFDSSVRQVHFEGASGAGTIGILLKHQNITVDTNRISGFETLLQYGIAGSSTQVSNYNVRVNAMSTATTGLLITDGGSREGFTWIGTIEGTVTTEIVNNRLAVDNDINDFGFVSIVELGKTDTLLPARLGHLTAQATNVVSASISAQTCQAYGAIPVPGARDGDTVFASPERGTMTPGIEASDLGWNAYATMDSVVIRACNPTGVAINLGDTQTWAADVWVH